VTVGVQGFSLIVVFVLMTWGVAELSYRWFERPFLRLKSRFARVHVSSALVEAQSGPSDQIPIPLPIHPGAQMSGPSLTDVEESPPKKHRVASNGVGDDVEATPVASTPISGNGDAHRQGSKDSVLGREGGPRT
jgi:hypothetical protein